MPFSVRYQGETILTVDEQVTRVAIQTARGETGAAGISPDEGVIDLVLDLVPPGGPVRLDQLEMAQRRALQDRSPEGTVVGQVRDFQVQPTRSSQGYHDETTREGDIERGQQQVFSQGPSKDLASGLDSRDTDTLNARLQAYGDHGDADRAIRENLPNSGGFTAESGFTGSEGTASDSYTSADDRSPTPVGAQTSDSGEPADASGPQDGGLSGSEDSEPESKSATKSAGIKVPGKAGGR
jgi:hypothetical protein